MQSYEGLLYCRMKLDRTYTVKQMANLLRLDGRPVPAKTIDAWTRGPEHRGRRVPADAVPALYEATRQLGAPDRTLLTWFTERFGLEIVEPPRGRQVSKPHLLAQTAQVAGLLGLLTGDPHDRERRAELHKALDELIPALVALRGKVSE